MNDGLTQVISDPMEKKNFEKEKNTATDTQYLKKDQCGAKLITINTMQLTFHKEH